MLWQQKLSVVFSPICIHVGFGFWHVTNFRLHIVLGGFFCLTLTGHPLFSSRSFPCQAPLPENACTKPEVSFEVHQILDSYKLTSSPVSDSHIAVFGGMVFSLLPWLCSDASAHVCVSWVVRVLLC